MPLRPRSQTRGDYFKMFWARPEDSAAADAAEKILARVFGPREDQPNPSSQTEARKMKAKENTTWVPVREIVLTMDPEDAADLRCLMGFNVNIPEYMKRAGLNPSRVKDLMTRIFDALGDAGVHTKDHTLNEEDYEEEND